MEQRKVFKKFQFFYILVLFVPEHPIGFFNGEAMKGLCGARMVLKVGRNSVFKC